MKKIQKDKLLSFIEKYNLGGTNEIVAWELNKDEKTLSTKFYPEDKTLLGSVTLKNVEVDEDREIYIYNTKKEKPGIKALGSSPSEELEIEYIQDGDRIVKIKLKDSNEWISSIPLADKSIMSVVPNLKKLPNFGVKFNLKKSDVEVFWKMKGSLEISNIITIIPSKKGLRWKFGHSSQINVSDREFSMPTETGMDTITKEVSFSANHLSNIFDANIDALSKPDSQIEVLLAEEGLMAIKIDTDDFICNYYLTQVKL